MAGSKSDYLENAYLSHLFGKSSLSVPTIYVGLFTSTPSDAGGGTEVSGGSYARKSTAAADWTTPSGGSIENANAITFAEATADWGEVTQFGLFDALSGGNLLYWGDLSVSKEVYSGDTPSYPAGDLVVTED